jgi:type VI secretion system protein ImpJ
MSGPCALSIAESRDIGVYVPADVPGAYLELAILLPK